MTNFAFAFAFADRDEAPSAVPAAWPTGFARLGVTVTCERCDVLDACEDWRASAPVKRDKPPFCPDRAAAGGLQR